MRELKGDAVDNPGVRVQIGPQIGGAIVYGEPLEVDALFKCPREVCDLIRTSDELVAG